MKRFFTLLIAFFAIATGTQAYTLAVGGYNVSTNWGSRNFDGAEWDAETLTLGVPTFASTDAVGVPKPAAGPVGPVWPVAPVSPLGIPTLRTGASGVPEMEAVGADPAGSDVAVAENVAGRPAALTPVSMYPEDAVSHCIQWPVATSIYGDRPM